MKLTKLLLTFSLCCTTTGAFALDLKEALERAKQYDTTFQAAYAAYQAASEAANLTTAPVLPQVGFSAFAQRGKTRNESFGNSSFLPSTNKTDNNRDGYSLSLNQVIYDKSKFDSMHQGDALVAKAIADLEVAKQDTILRVTRAYFDVLAAMDTLETSTAEKKAIGKQLEQSKERFKVGLSAITDVKEQQASYDIAVANEIIAINDLSNKREALQVIINMYPDNLEVVRHDIPLAIPEPLDIEAWQNMSLQNNFSLRSAKYSVDAAEYAYKSSKGGHYPTVSLNASYDVVNSDERTFSGLDLPANENTDTKVLLSLNVPIYQGGFVSSTVRQKLSELDRAKALHEQEKRRTMALARSAYLSVKSDIATVKARKQAVNSTQASLDATLAGYDAGTRTSVDVLLSQRLLYSSQRDYYLARYTYLTDSLRLKQVAGSLSEADIEIINEWLEPDDKPEQSIMP